MRRAIPILALVVGFTCVAAQATITTTISYVGTYTIGLGAGPVVDVYKVHMHTNVGVLGALVIEIGWSAGEPCYAMGIPVDPNDPNSYDNPFQAWWTSYGKSGNVQRLTGSEDEAAVWLTPPDSSKCYEADTRFLPADIGTWGPAIYNPKEDNDGSIYDGGTEDYFVGVGRLGVAVGLQNYLREIYGADMDVALVGVVRGTTVYLYTGSADSFGITTKERMLVPEPVTLTLLGAGSLCLARRRRIGPASRRKGTVEP
jgi:hypothetical protein